jgi:hypothetical protein
MIIIIIAILNNDMLLNMLISCRKYVAWKAGVMASEMEPATLHVSNGMQQGGAVCSQASEGLFFE